MSTRYAAIQNPLTQTTKAQSQSAVYISLFLSQGICDRMFTPPQQGSGGEQGREKRGETGDTQS